MGSEAIQWRETALLTRTQLSTPTI